MDSNKCKKLIKIMEKACRVIKTHNEVEEWIKFGKKNIKLLKKLLKVWTLSHGQKIQIQTTIIQLQSILEQIKDKKKAGMGIGGDNRKLKDRVKWIDVESIFQGRNNLKVNGILSCKFQVMKNNEIVEETKYFNTKNDIILPTTDLNNWFDEKMTDKLLVKVEEFQERDSGWTMKEIINLNININLYEPIRVTAALHPAQTNSNRVSSYPHFKTILKYEDDNNDDNDYDYDDSDNDNDIFENNDDNEIEKTPTTFHFAWIRNLSRLISSQISKNEHKLWLCDRCLCHFKTQKSFENHSDDCLNQNNARMIMPDQENNILKFKNYKFKEPAPFSIYADLECILQPEASEKDLHIPYSVGYYFHCTYDDSLSKFAYNRSEKCIEWFVNELEKITKQVNNILNNPLPMEQLTFQQERELRLSKKCHICEKPLTENDKIVIDHSHMSGRIRGLAHSNCSIKLLPINKEKYVSFTKEVRYKKLDGSGSNCIHLRFLDSFKFMPSSLDKLASYLEDCDKKITRKYCNSEEEFQLLKRKGAYPYEYTDSFDKLNETSLPPKENFFSKLSNENISDSDYEHAIKVWDTFNIKTLGDYSDIYLQADVLLLADVFENFRKNCISNYGLDPIHYYTIPGYSFDCMLKCTEIELELLTDPEKYLFIEKGIRGGVAQCTNRYAKANNRYMPDFDTNIDESYIMYYDINNLYGHSMMNYLPYAGFEWYDDKNIDVFKIADDSDIGYILEVDLEYPESLFDDHRDFPLCPEHLIPPNSKQVKLMTTLYPKKNYVIHYRSLKQYLGLGMQLSKIHRILKFKQSPWLKKYIDFNTQKRQESTNAFGVLIFKLLNNVIYGKAIENLRGRRDVKMITKWDGRYGAKSLISKPNFHSSMILGKDLVVIEMSRKTYGNSAKLLYMDTDALAYLFTVPDIYECMKKNLEKFDTADYPENNIYNMPLVNKRKIGVMKDENQGKIVTEFVGLRAKAYSMKILNEDKIIKKAKGK
ncbi:uncharacterized protein LOC122860176 [Aphidius gifuensis]|uniref:uncharacterized protein LOC122860176 n=1 Tax=Aphidius gifuensis TaxID=684658 RepID=UPI001CDBBADD|nr:uncharacterized protein LOC122860176 [Aphidius gifuensis]